MPRTYARSSRPSISTQPQSLVINQGNTATFSVVAGGTAVASTLGSVIPTGRFQKTQALALGLGLAALLSVPFWHAPALVWWHGQGLAQSLFSSTLACWRNKGAFTIFGVAWMGVLTTGLLLVTFLGFLIWGIRSGQFKNIEEAKHRIFDDRADDSASDPTSPPAGPGGERK